MRFCESLEWENLINEFRSGHLFWDKLKWIGGHLIWYVGGNESIFYATWAVFGIAYFNCLWVIVLFESQNPL